MTDDTFYRAIRLSWAFAPLSGEGAAINGGRWNAKGTPTLYLAGDPMTALAEYNQDLLFRPVTLIEYHVANAKLADARYPDFCHAHGIADAAFTQAWRAETLQNRTPAGWTAAARLQSEGFEGVIYSSRINGGVCLALWHWNDDRGCSVTVGDADGRLPVDNRSWPPG